MEKKYYQIAATSPEDWEKIHSLLTEDGTLEDNVPSHCCECVDPKEHSLTRSTYLLTNEEADALKNHPSVAGINLDPEYHPESAIKVDPYILKYGRNVRNYRAGKEFNSVGSAVRSVIPTGDYDGRSSGEFYRTGYQILRCAQRNNPWPSDATTVLNQDVDYLYDGSDIDVIVCDNGFFYGHPEFTSDEYDPPNYIRGNVLNRSAQCGLLDVILDGPYYLDPDYFDANPSARLITRWDGTRVPKEDIARQWWSSSTYRSPRFNAERRSGEFSIFINPAYRRVSHCGADRLTPPANTSDGDHGTPCASLVYGKNFGWAFNANKWTITIALYVPRTRGVTSGAIPAELSFDIQKIFHLNKPANPKFISTRNPTISSNSWGAGGIVPSGSGRSSYQSVVGAERATSDLSGVPFLISNSPNPYILNYGYSAHFDDNNPSIVSGREMVEIGVHFFCAGGNDGRYMASPTDPNFHNYYITSGAPSGFETYVNRPGFPAQIGYRSGWTSYKSYVIGAMDDLYTGDSPAYTNTIYTAAGTGKEKLARGFGNYNSISGDYSNRGTGVDFYAPADGTLAASSSTDQAFGGLNVETYQNPYQISTTSRYNDRYMNGTSAACPVAAGLAACLLQNNRDQNPEDFKSYLKSMIQNQSNFFTGIAPTSRDDRNWYQVPHNTMGTPVKIIYQFPTTTRTPNQTFTPTFGLDTASAANERFTLNHNTGSPHTFGIYGINVFDSRTDATGLSFTRTVRNGYYYVGCRDYTTPTLGDIVVRVHPTNNKRVQMSDSGGRDSWDDMQITVEVGQFQQIGHLVYYVYNGGTLPVTTPSGGTITGPISSGGAPSGAGSPGSIRGASLRVYGAISANGDIYGLLSDDRVKKNKKTIDNALEKLENLHGFTYNFNETGEKLGFNPDETHSGVSAQDVQEVLPEAVAPAPADENYLTVKYDKLIPLLIESLKDLKGEIDDLKDSK